MVRVQRFFQLNKNGFTPDPGCRHNLDEGVNHVTIPKAITCHLALPVSFCVGAEVSLPYSDRVSRLGSGKVYSRLYRTTWSRDRRVECAGRSRSFAGDGSTEGFEFRIHGNSQGSNSDPGVQQVSTPQTPTVLGQSFLGAGLLC